MRINIKIWIGVIIVSVLVIFFRNFDFQLNKKYLINRVYRDNSITVVKNPFIDSLDVSTVYSDDIICSYHLSPLDSSLNLCSVVYYDIIHFNPADHFSFKLPKTAQIKYCTGKQVFYIDKFNLYSYALSGKQYEKLNPDNFKCLNVSQVNATVLLLYGEDLAGSAFRTGYFTLDLISKKFLLSKQIEENKTSFAARNSLIYSGKFTRTDSSNTCYYCDKYCKLFFFDNEGKYVKEFSTDDKTPKPELVSTGEAFYYKRGSTFNVNNAILVEKNKLLAFSCRSSPVNYLLIDVYSLESSAYLYSTRLSYKDWNCPDVISVSHSGGNSIVHFQHGTGLFNFSAVD